MNKTAKLILVTLVASITFNAAAVNFPTFYKPQAWSFESIKQLGSRALNYITSGNALNDFNNLTFAQTAVGLGALLVGTASYLYFFGIRNDIYLADIKKKETQFIHDVRQGISAKGLHQNNKYSLTIITKDMPIKLPTSDDKIVECTKKRKVITQIINRNTKEIISTKKTIIILEN